ncbi:MAG TPA: hypothetical protein VKA83_00740 [Methylomirabilota bacterium]|nr:hypothetical protein [Methylomirabilota bacterium]
MPLPPEQTQYPLAENAAAALDFIESEIPGIDTMSAMLNQRQREDGTLYDVMDIGFRIVPSEIVYFVHPDASKDWPNIAVGEIILKADKVLSIYQGLPERAAIFALPPDWELIH